MTHAITDNTDLNTDEPFDDEIVMLPGWPGYRTRPGRTGLDYLDTQYELAHIAGVFLRKALTRTMYPEIYGPRLWLTWLATASLWIILPGDVSACPTVLIIVAVAITMAFRGKYAHQHPS